MRSRPASVSFALTGDRLALAIADWATSSSVRSIPRASSSIRMPIAITRGEVHICEVAFGSQDGIDETHAFEDRGPIERRYEAHARDDVADGHVHSDLALVFLADDRLGSGALVREALVQPDQRRRDPRVLIAQTLEQPNNEGRRQARRVEPGQRRVWRLGRPAADPEQAIG